MVAKPNKPLITALSKAEIDAEPVTRDERLQTERVKEVLDQILYLAVGNKDIASALCKTAALIATCDEKLSGFLKNSLKKGNGRPAKWAPWMNRILLIHYAQAMISQKGSHQLVRKELINYVLRMNGTLLAEEAIENCITKAIDNVRKGKISLDDLPDWAQPIIQDRIKRGEMTKKSV